VASGSRFVVSWLHAPVAQLDRAADFESVGRGFEPLRARHLTFGDIEACLGLRLGILTQQFFTVNTVGDHRLILGYFEKRTFDRIRREFPPQDRGNPAHSLAVAFRGIVKGRITERACARRP
jgi:hypothetical protein